MHLEIGTIEMQIQNLQCNILLLVCFCRLQSHRSRHDESVFLLENQRRFVCHVFMDSIHRHKLSRKASRKNDGVGLWWDLVVEVQPKSDDRVSSRGSVCPLCRNSVIL